MYLYEYRQTVIIRMNDVGNIRLKELIILEKRRDKRLDLESQIIIKRLDSSEGEASETVDILLKDVSKSGVGFLCNYPLEIGAVYECQLTLWTKEKIHSFIEIVRVLSKDDTYFYGGIFIGMSEMDIKRIEIYFTFHDADVAQ